MEVNSAGCMEGSAPEKERRGEACRLELKERSVSSWQAGLFKKKPVQEEKLVVPCIRKGGFCEGAFRSRVNVKGEERKDIRV